MSKPSRSAASPCDFRIDVERRGPVAVLRLVGSAGMNVADRLRDQLVELIDKDVRELILDMSGLEFISSVGLGAMIVAYVRCCRQNAVLKLVNPRPDVERVLEVTKLKMLFPIYPSVDAALAGRT